MSSHSLVLQVPLQGSPLTLRLVDEQGIELAAVLGVNRDPSGIRAWFGSVRIRLLEQIQGGFYKDSEVKKIVTGLGYVIKRGKRSLYPEKERNTALYLHELLVAESLRYGIPSTLTALVCTGERAGTPVKATVIVPSASPSGWDTECCYEMRSPFEEAIYKDLCDDHDDERIKCSMTVPYEYHSPELRFYEQNQRFSDYLMTLQRGSSCSHEHHLYKEIEVSFEQIPDGILFEGLLKGWGGMTGICVVNGSITPVPPDIRIEISLNTETTPRARIALSDLLDGDIRPLHITLKKSDRIIIALRDDLHHLRSGSLRLKLMSN